MQRGISPAGRHYIPAFPYTSYAAMRTEDVLDIKAYLATLAPVKTAKTEQGLVAETVLRRGVGLWKWLGLATAPWQPDPSRSESWNRGAYLVNAPGRCAECHTPRNLVMARDAAKSFRGGPHPDGTGKVPSLRKLIERGRYKDRKDLTLALQHGETFGYENISSGGMGQVQMDIARLPEADIAAIAEYLVSLE